MPSIDFWGCAHFVPAFLGHVRPVSHVYVWLWYCLDYYISVCKQGQPTKESYSVFIGMSVMIYVKFASCERQCHAHLLTIEPFSRSSSMPTSVSSISGFKWDFYNLVRYWLLSPMPWLRKSSQVKSPCATSLELPYFQEIHLWWVLRDFLRKRHSPWHAAC